VVYIWIRSSKSEFNNNFECKKSIIESKAPIYSFKLESILEVKSIIL